MDAESRWICYHSFLRVYESRFSSTHHYLKGIDIFIKCGEKKKEIQIRMKEYYVKKLL